VPREARLADENWMARTLFPIPARFEMIRKRLKLKRLLEPMGLGKVIVFAQTP